MNFYKEVIAQAGMITAEHMTQFIRVFKKFFHKMQNDRLIMRDKAPGMQGRSTNEYAKDRSFIKRSIYLGLSGGSIWVSNPVYVTAIFEWRRGHRHYCCLLKNHYILVNLFLIYFCNSLLSTTTAMSPG